MGFEFRTRIGNLNRIRSQITTSLPRKVTKQWGTRWWGFIRKRFDSFSKGGGDWAPLAESTLLGRRRTARARKSIRQLKRRSLRVLARQQSTSILRDTGILFGATQVNGRGSIFENIDKGVRVGFAGAKMHKRGHATVAQIAIFHQRGGARLPQRKILVPPDDATQQAMLGDYKREVNAIMGGGAIGGGPSK